MPFTAQPEAPARAEAGASGWAVNETPGCDTQVATPKWRHMLTYFTSLEHFGILPE
jgi:hypothetical protein